MQTVTPSISPRGPRRRATSRWTSSNTRDGARHTPLDWLDGYARLIEWAALAGCWIRGGSCACATRLKVRHARQARRWDARRKRSRGTARRLRCVAGEARSARRRSPEDRVRLEARCQRRWPFAASGGRRLRFEADRETAASTCRSTSSCLAAVDLLGKNSIRIGLTCAAGTTAAGCSSIRRRAVAVSGVTWPPAATHREEPALRARQSSTQALTSSSRSAPSGSGELPRRQADVPALVRLIAVEPAPGNPLSLLVEHAFLGDVDADERRAVDPRP